MSLLGFQVMSAIHAFVLQCFPYLQAMESNTPRPGFSILTVNVCLARPPTFLYLWHLWPWLAVRMDWVGVEFQEYMHAPACPHLSNSPSKISPYCPLGQKLTQGNEEWGNPGCHHIPRPLQFHNVLTRPAQHLCLRNSRVKKWESKKN
jgi:hypothetical protein